MRIIGLWLTLTLISLPVTATAATERNTDFYLPGCRDFAEHKSPLDSFLQGECVGIIEALAIYAQDFRFESSKSCMPDDVTLGQMTTTVVRWLDRRPQRWNEDFTAPVLEALHDAWPCK
jgi:hypothetical protein